MLSQAQCQSADNSAMQGFRILNSNLFEKPVYFVYDDHGWQTDLHRKIMERETLVAGMVWRGNWQGRNNCNPKLKNFILAAMFLKVSFSQ